jgi:phosphoserine phosphatase
MDGPRARIAAAGEAGVTFRGLVIFDLDGTLLRGPTVCELLASRLGKLSEMRQFEALRDESAIAQARLEMAGWYQAVKRDDLLAALEEGRSAPGAIEGIAHLRHAGIEVAIASITWKFAVDWFAGRWAVARTLGTALNDDGTIGHIWPDDKAKWLRKLSRDLALAHERTAAVGDSFGDFAVLHAAALRFFVGSQPPTEFEAVHLPDGDISEIAQNIVAQWAD